MYLVFLECGDVVSVNITQTGDYHLYIPERTLGLKFLAHTHTHILLLESLVVGLDVHRYVCAWVQAPSYLFHTLT